MGRNSLWTQSGCSFGGGIASDNLTRTMRRKVLMSDLIARLLQRAHLAEFRICGEAAEALEAAQRERDEANRRYHEISSAWLRAQQTARSKRPQASHEALTLGK